MKKEVAESIVEENRRIYNQIAEQFSSTRKYPWSDFSFFEQYVKNYDKVLDIGCGNGRLASFLSKKNIEYIGLDNSERLIEHAKRERPSNNFLVGEATSLPFPDNNFNVIFMIATLHHVPSKKLRNQVIRESHRALKSKGYLIMTEWNIWNKQWWSLLINSVLKKAFGKSGLDWRDVKKPWKNPKGDIIGERFLHPFTRGELDQLLQKNGFTVIRNIYTKKGAPAQWYNAYNIITIAQA